MFFDTHAHYDDEQFSEDREDVLRSLPEAGISLLVNPGCDGDSSAEAVRLAHAFPFMYAAVGWHPEAASSFDASALETLRRLADDEKVKAIGEIGLDYHYPDAAPRQTQKEVFASQLNLARELGLPVIVHDREAHADALEMVCAFPTVTGVFHCYSGSVEMARELLARGWYLSFTGVITFKNAKKALEVIKMCPIDRLMLETDSPYMAPTPHRGQRCDSRFLPLIAGKAASVKGLSVEELALRTTENGKRFFHIEE